MIALRRVLKTTFCCIWAWLLLASAGAVYAESGRPGDEFRATAGEYQTRASRAMRAATGSQGDAANLYIKLANIYTRMAGIKRKAAELADQNRWDDIDWVPYQDLERRKDDVLALLGPQALPNQELKSGAKGFLEAASGYAEQAAVSRSAATKTQGTERAIHLKLAHIYESMSNIKRQAASAAERGKSFDWTKYEKLDERRNELTSLLALAEKGKKLGGTASN